MISASLELVLLASSVRFGTQPDESELLDRYLTASHDFARSLSPLQRREHWESVFHLLMETYCDSAVPAAWRRLCVDSVHRPLGELTLLSQLDGEVSVLRRCLGVLKSYTDYLPTAATAVPGESDDLSYAQRPGSAM